MIVLFRLRTIVFMLFRRQTNNRRCLQYIRHRTCHTKYTHMLSTEDNGVVDLRDRYAMQRIINDIKISYLKLRDASQ